MSLSAQEVFDIVARHLRRLRRRSIRQDRVAVRGYRGLKDPLGCLLSDAEVTLPDGVETDPLRETHCGRTIDALRASDIETLLSIGLIPDRLVPHAGLVANLCAVHDNPWCWKDDGWPDLGLLRRGLLRIASVHNLDDATVIHLFGAVDPARAAA